MQNDVGGRSEGAAKVVTKQTGSLILVDHGVYKKTHIVDIRIIRQWYSHRIGIVVPRQMSLRFQTPIIRIQSYVLHLQSNNPRHMGVLFQFSSVQMNHFATASYTAGVVLGSKINADLGLGSASHLQNRHEKCVSIDRISLDVLIYCVGRITFEGFYAFCYKWFRTLETTETAN
ncbi:hypothetical protein IQ07DRAFT_599287 [Pyrenochaeta sp. DS3sAY3a]|nr:hypothetical protein IQ07DRAFT_599287 [Pyrenochaeta sp. DS3sAY3a]